MIRWLVIGAGQAGMCHIAAIEQVANAQLVGVVDPVSSAAFTAPLFRELSNALRNTQPDAVVIAAPNDLHVALAKQVIDAGIPVLCEKPVGRTANDAQLIHDHGHKCGVPVGVVLNQRLHAAAIWTKNLIANGQFDPRAAFFDGAVPGLGSWHIDVARSGGGALRTIGIHYLDLMVWWFGSPVKFSAMLGGGPPETIMAVDLTFADGRIAGLHLTAMGTTSAGPVRGIISGAVTRVVLDGHRVANVVGLPGPPAPEPFDPAMKYGPGHLNLIAAASAGLPRGDGFPVSMADALPTLRLIDDIYRMSIGAA